MGPHCFWASAVSPVRGSYSAGKTSLFKLGFWASQRGEIPQSNDKNSVEALEILRTALLQKGWEPTGQVGNAWWQHVLRRRVKA